jgi:nucleolar GTP-binding protein
MNQITITYPKADGGDDEEEVGVRRRPKAFIPESVKQVRAREEERRRQRLDDGEVNEEEDEEEERIVTERDLELANGGTGVYSVDITKNYILDNADYRLDHIPNIVNGKNVFDYIDPEIERRLEELLREEDALMEEYNERLQNEVEEDPLTHEEQELHQEIRDEVASIRHTSRMNKNSFKPVQKRSKTLKDFREHLRKRKELDLPQETINQLQSKSQKRRSRSQRTYEEIKRNSFAADEPELPSGDMMSEEGAPSLKKLRKLKKSLTRHSRSRSSSHLPESTPQARGLRNEDDLLRVHRIEEKVRQVEGFSSRSNSGDRKTFPKLNKHLIAGKMGMGTRRWR